MRGPSMGTKRRSAPPARRSCALRAGAPTAGQRAAAPRERGFTVLELLVSVSLIAVVMTIVLTTFDVNSALSRVQQDISELQQSVRIAQREIAHNTRMAGRGGLPRRLAIDLMPNVAAGTTFGTGPDQQTVLEGTDVLTLRGTLDSPIYKVDAGDEDTFQIVGTTATLLIDSITRSGFDQPVDSLEALDAGEPILLVSRQGDTIYAVVELTSVAIEEDHQLPTGILVDRATLTLNLDPNGGTHNSDYMKLSMGGIDPPIFPVQLTSVAFASVLEEFRYYVREDHVIPMDDTSPLSPKLARMRVVPGTDPPLVHPEPGSVAVDIADAIFDLQLGLGIDIDNDGVIDELDGAGAPLAGDEDEWQWNHEGDDPVVGPDGITPWTAGNLRLVRLTFLGQAGRADREYIAPAIATLEDRDYSEPQVPTTGTEIADRRYRRRMLQSVVDLRNL